jgi:hypothetical protein
MKLNCRRQLLTSAAADNLLAGNIYIPTFGRHNVGQKNGVGSILEILPKLFLRENI